jgi:YggT family protein
VVDLFLNTLMIMIVIRALLSWINIGTYNPAISLLYNITDPILNLGRKLIPTISGIDLSPMIIIVGLEFFRRLLGPMFHDLMVAIQPVAF